MATKKPNKRDRRSPSGGPSQPPDTVPGALFRGVVRPEGGLVAGAAATVDGAARFFVRQRGETEDLFVGRITGWLKESGAENLQMSPPEVLPAGVELGEVVMRVRHAVGLGRGDPQDSSAFDLPNATVVWSGQKIVQ